MPISREAWTLPRWARTTGGVDQGSPDVEAPPSQQMDDGWLADDVPVRSWWNWVWRESYKGLLYLTDALFARDPLTTIPRGQLGESFDHETATGEITILTGTGQIQGQLYEFAETTVSLPVQSAVTLMHRIIVARLVAGVPTIAKVDGVSNAVDPTLLTHDIPLWRVKMATGATSYTVEDMREFGKLEVDRIVADKTLIASGGSTWELRDSGGSPALAYSPTTDEVQLGALSWKLEGGFTRTGIVVSERVRRKTLHPAHFAFVSGAAVRELEGLRLASSSDDCTHPIEEFPPGSVIRFVDIAYTTPNNTNGAVIILQCRSRLTGLVVWQSITNITNVAAATTRVKSALINQEVLQDHMFVMEVAAGSNHDITIHSVSIEYHDEYPFRSLTAFDP